VRSLHAPKGDPFSRQLTTSESNKLGTMPEAILLGDINVDIIAHHPKFPVQGVDAFAASLEFHCGGSAANAALVLAELGTETALIARVGPDPWAPMVLRRLADAGVCLDYLQQDPAVMTGLMYVIVTPDGERTILGDRGANARTDPSKLRQVQFGGANLFYLSGYALLSEPQCSAALLALEMAVRDGLVVVLDPGMSGYPWASQEMRGCLANVDLLLPNLVEARAMTGLTAPEDCVEALLAAGVSAVALKLGSEGCLMCEAGRCTPVPGFRVRVQDSTGAGDSFAGGLIAGYLGGLSLTAAASLANAMGALTASRIGAGREALDLRAVLALLTSSDSKLIGGQHRMAIDEAAGFVKALLESTEGG
jgi:ribokinase